MAEIVRREAEVAALREEQLRSCCGRRCRVVVEVVEGIGDGVVVRKRDGDVEQ